MSGVIGAELTKMRKRTGLLVILGVWPLLIFLFGYLANYLFRNAAGMPDEIRAGITDSILPNQFVANAVGGFPLFGFALGLIFGALVVGSEYGWGTVGNLLIQGPTRLQVHLGRLTALVIMSLVMTLCALAIAATSSVVFSGLLDQTSDWPPLAEIARGLGAGWLIMTVAMFLGATAALLLRGTALAIGLGLVYVLVVESLFAGFSATSETVESIARFLPGVNAGALSSAVQNANTPEVLAPPFGEAISGQHATIVLIGYLVVLTIGGLVVFQKRDVA